MLRIKQATTAILFAIMMVTSMAAKASVCEAEQPTQANISHSLVDQKLTNIGHSKDSNQHSGKEQHAQHCHCVNQVCCGFLVIPVISSVGTDSKAKDSPLVSAVLYSWISAPPTRPPSV